MSPSCTADLLSRIDEEFESAEKLYYRMDYGVGMQIVDGQTVYIRFRNRRFVELEGSGQSLCLLAIELHRGGKPLYAVMVRNDHRESKQRWKMVEYDGGDISRAFMTADALRARYGLFRLDLPKGSRTLHFGFHDLLRRIDVTKKLIRSTNWAQCRVIRSKQSSLGMVCCDAL